MALVYGTNLTNQKALPALLKSNKKETFIEWLTKTVLQGVRFLFDTVFDSIIGNAVASLTGIGIGARFLIKYVFNLASEIVQDIIFNKGHQVDWKSLLIRAGLNLLSFLNKTGIDKLKKTKFGKTKFGKFIASSGKNIAEDITTIWKHGTWGLVNVIKRRVFALGHKLLAKLQTTNLGEYANRFFKTLKSLIPKISKGLQFIEFITSPKKIVDWLFGKLKTRAAKFIDNTVKKVWNRIKFSKLIKAKTNKEFLNRLKKKYNNKISFPRSKWIAGVKIFDHERWDMSTTISYTIYFRWSNTLGTNPKRSRKTGELIGKLPIIRWRVPKEELLGLIKAPSAGKYYIDNISWGWEDAKKRDFYSKSFKGIASGDFMMTHKYLNFKRDKKYSLWERDRHNLDFLMLDYDNRERYQNDWNYLSKLRNNRRVGNIYPVAYRENGKMYFKYAKASEKIDFTDKKKFFITQKIGRYKPKKGK